MCQLGLLGGLEPVTDFNPIANLPTGVQFTFYGSAFVLGTASFLLADTPPQQMVAKAEDGRGARLRRDRPGALLRGGRPGRDVFAARG